MNGILTYGLGNYGDYYTIVTYGFSNGAGLYRLSLAFNLSIDQVVSIELER
jgi:hypothetical protein